MLTREEFQRSRGDLKRETVEISGLGLVTMRELSVGERLDVLKRFEGIAEGCGEDEADMMQSLALVAVSLCDADGSSWYGLDDLAEGVAILRLKAPSTLRALQTKFLEMSGVGAQDIEAAVGNSIAIPSGIGSSGSPETSDTRQPELSATP